MNDEDHYCENCGMDLYGMGPVYVDYMDMPYCSIDCLAERNTYRKYCLKFNILRGTSNGKYY